ncbi:putative leucine-rich repeat domain superfamily [Helianthus annuus]|nr:putative leucine-rich repeat domain superfamily [Helianthus annuus]
MTEDPEPEQQQQITINERLRDDELRAVLSKLETDKDKEVFGLVCKKWLYLQSTERKKLCARAGPHMLKKMAARFTRLKDLDLSQSASRSFYPGVTDSDLSVIASGFTGLCVLKLRDCKVVIFGLLQISFFLNCELYVYVVCD